MFICESAHFAFKDIVRCGGQTRQLLLRRIAVSLHANALLAKIRHTDMEGDGTDASSDGFVLILASELLRLAVLPQPGQPQADGDRPDLLFGARAAVGGGAAGVLAAPDRAGSGIVPGAAALRRVAARRRQVQLPH